MDGFHIRNGVLEEYDGEATDVIVPEEVREIGEEAFWGMDVERVHLPEGLRKIHSDAFYNCHHLKEINLPDSIRYIGREAFSHTGLEHIVLPRGLKSLSEGQFSFSHFREITIPEGIERIGDSAFRGCHRLEVVHLPRSLKHIGFGAFEGASALRQIDLPEGVYVSGRAFDFCNALADENGFIVVDGMFFKSPALYRSHEVTLPEGVRVIKYGSIDIRRDMDGVMWADNQMDWLNALWEKAGGIIRLPSTVEEIETGAFLGDVEHIISDAKAPFGWSTLVSCRDLQSLTVPKGTVVSEDVFGSRREDRELLQKLKIVYT